MKIIIGMSGGVDSSAAAALLVEKGYDVVGVTLKMWPTNCGRTREDICFDERAIAAAADVAARLGIPHQVRDIQPLFRKRVISYFCREYRKGRTPNPCVVCNAAVKFPTLIRLADELGAGFVATGHYARVERRDGRAFLLRGRDREKDQAYFLSRLPQPVFRRVQFPLGNRTKSGIKKLATEKGLGVGDRPESQEICFIPDDDYRGFLREAFVEGAAPGKIVDKDGEVIGTHEGIEYYTVGQRKGLNIRSNVRRYVVSIDPERRELVVGGIDDLAGEELRATDMNWIAFEKPPGPFRALVKIRYRHPGADATVTPRDDGSVSVRFDEAQKGITPGQAAVIYDRDLVIGGGWIA